MLIRGDSWPKLHKAAGLPEETDQQWFNDYYSGQIDYFEWNREIENFYIGQKVTRALVERVLFDYELLDGARSTIERIDNMGIPIAVLSTGIDLLVEKVSNDLGIKEWRTNTQMLFDRKDELRKIVIDHPDDACKAIFIKEICQQVGIKPEETMFVGDSIVDIEAFSITLHGVLVGRKHPELGKYAWKQIDKLGDVVTILGRQ